MAVAKKCVHVETSDIHKNFRSFEVEEGEARHLRDALSMALSGEVNEPPWTWMQFAVLGQKISAIKALREVHPMGLAEAKNTVEDFIRELNQTFPHQEHGWEFTLQAFPVIPNNG